MERDYQRFRLSRQIRKLAIGMCGEEVLGVLDDYAYLSAVAKSDNVGDAVYRYSFDMKDPQNAFLFRECIRVCGIKPHWCRKFIHRLNALIRNYYKKTITQPAKTSMTIYAISYRQFYKKFKFNHYPSWICINRNDIARMMMRYNSIIYTGSVLCIPETAWGVLVNEFDVWAEAYTTPLTSQITVSNGYGKYFCSLFTDTDRVFGSMGNFFNCIIRNGSIVVHPHACVMEAAAHASLNYCVEATKSDEYLRFFFFAPVEEFTTLDTSEFLTFKYIMKPGKYFYDLYSLGGVKCKTIGKTPLTLWVLETHTGDDKASEISTNYEKIPIAMGSPDIGFKIENYSNRYQILSNHIHTHSRV